MDQDQDVKAALEDVVLYRLNAEKGEGLGLAKEFNVKGYPTFVMLNENGQATDRWAGYSKEFLLTTLESALSDMTPIPEKMARFDLDPNIHDAEVLGRYSRSLYEYVDAANYYKAAQKLNRDPDRDFRYEIFSNTAGGARKDLFTYEEVADAADSVLASPHGDAGDKYSVAAQITSLAKKEDNPRKAAPYLEAGIEALRGSDEPDDARHYAALMADYSLYVSDKPEQAVKYKKETMPEGWTEDAGQLNNFSWWCFENDINLQEAEDLSRKSVKLAEPGREKAMFLDTLAEIYNARGKPYEAIELMKIAVKEAPDDEYYKKQLERFEKLVASDN